MSGSTTSWMDALPAVQPTQAMILQGASAPAPAAPYPMVAPHLAPDNSGAMTNLSDADYARLMAGKGAPDAASAPAKDQSWQDALPAVAPTTAMQMAGSDGSFKPSPAPAQSQEGFLPALAGSTAATLDAIPRGLVGDKTVDYGNALMQTPIRMITGLQGPTAAFNEGLQNEETTHNALAAKYPIASVGGELMGGAAGGAAAAPALGWEAVPATAGILPKVGNALGYVARNAGFGAMMSDLSGGNPVTGAAVGAVLPAAHVIGSTTIGQPLAWAYNKLAPIWSQVAREGSVGNALNRVVGGSPVETSPVGPLDLGAATNNANVAAKVDVAPTFNAKANEALRTAQQQGVTNQISQIGAPATAADASTTGVNAIRDLAGMARQRESELWNNPALTDYLFRTDGLKQSAQSAVNAIQKDDPGLMLGMVGPINDAISGIAKLPDQANLGNINSYIGVLKSVARRPPMDNPRAGALANRILSSVQKGLDDTVTSSGAPSTVQSAYQAARDFTRTRAGIFGTQDMRAIMSKNPTGAFTAEPSEGMRRFFNFSNGSGEGPQNIKQLTDFADEIKQAWVGRGSQFDALSDARDKLRDAARSYVASALTDAARVNPGENLNPKLLQEFLNANKDWMRTSGLFGQSQIDATDQLLGYADMLRRPEQLIRQVGSATQPRSARANTFIDQIMTPWMRHLASLAALSAGAEHSGGIGALVGTAIGGGFEGAVTKAEASMRELMAKALLNPRVAQDLMMKANAANRVMMAPQTRQLLDTIRAAVGSDILPQLTATSPQAVPMGQ